MKKFFAGIVIGVASLAATACTPTQEGAAIGAGTGALVGTAIDGGGLGGLQLFERRADLGLALVHVDRPEDERARDVHDRRREQSDAHRPRAFEQNPEQQGRQPRE